MKIIFAMLLLVCAVAYSQPVTLPTSVPASIPTTAPVSQPATVPTTVPTTQPSQLTLDALDKAIESSGENIVYTKLVELSQKSPMQSIRIHGIFTLANLIVIIAAILGIVAIGYLLKDYLLSMPAIGHELLIYGTCGALLLVAQKIKPDVQLFALMPASLGILSGLIYSKFIRFPDGDSKGSFSLTFAITAFLWAAIAIYFNTSVIGFMAVMSFLVALGFSAFVTPGLIAIGFEDDASVARGTFGAFVLLFIYILGIFSWKAMPPTYQFFSFGFGFLGTFVYFLGLLIISSKYYTSKENYVFTQLLVILSGAAALYLGLTFGISILASVGGTFFCIYLLEKYCEIPWGRAWAVGLLGSAGLLYGIAWFMKMYPQVFIWNV